MKLPEEQDCEDEPSKTIASKVFKEAEVPKIKPDTVPLKGNVALARHSMLEARKLDTLYSC